MKLSPYEKISGFFIKIPKQIYFAFFAGVTSGILCHVLIWTNHMFNHDSINYFRPTAHGLLTQGKWFSGFWGNILGKTITSGASIPLGIIALSLAAAITVSMLEIRKSVSAIFIGALMVSFPSAASMAMYYGFGYFGMALFLAALSAYFTIKYKWGFIPGIIILVFSLGSYQSYIGFTTAIFVITIINRIIINEEKIKPIFLDGIKYISVLLISILLYYIVLKICLSITGLELSTYRGINNFESFSLFSILYTLARGFAITLKFFFMDGYGLPDTSLSLLYGASVILGFAFVIMTAIKTKLYKKRSLFIFVMLLFSVALPVSIHIIAVLGQNASTHWIMKYPFIAVFIALIYFAEKCQEQYFSDEEKNINKKNSSALTVNAMLWITIAVNSLLLFNWYSIDNQCYQKMIYIEKVAFHKASEIVYSIHSFPGYTADMPVIIYGTTDIEFLSNEDSVLNYYNSYEKITGFVNLEGAFNLARNNLQTYANKDLYAKINFIHEINVHRIELSKINDMPIFPYDGSIKIIDGIMIVKMSSSK